MDAEQLRQAYAEQYSPDRFLAFYRALAQEFFLLANPGRPIPISPVPLVLDAAWRDRFSRLASVLWAAIARPGYRRLSARNIPRPLRDPGRPEAEPIPFDPRSSVGCIDLHLDHGGPRVIEFMVLPPGVSGIYPGILSRYGEYLEACVPGCRADGFSPGWDRGRCESAVERHVLGGGAPSPERVAIVDWEPRAQITYGEFRYTLLRLREDTGVQGLIADPREVRWDGSAIRVRGLPVQRILNRLTLLDWTNHAAEIPDYTRLLWEAPRCFAYHPYLWYLGDKHSLTLLSDPRVRDGLGLGEEAARCLQACIPPTYRLSRFRRPDGGWDTEGMRRLVGGPAETVLKPVSSHASQGIFFGPADLPTAERLDAVLRDIDPEAYVAMRLVPPPEVMVPRGRGLQEPWKCDLRIFVIDGQYVFPGGRVYLGDYTNQVPCRTFAPLFFA